jgi:hypothetical protein
MRSASGSNLASAIHLCAAARAQMAAIVESGDDADVLERLDRLNEALAYGARLPASARDDLVADALTIADLVLAALESDESGS